MSDFTSICELRGRATNGRGCTNKNRYPNGVPHCAKVRGRGRCVTGDADAMNFDGATSAMQALREARSRAVNNNPEYRAANSNGVTLTVEATADAALTRIHSALPGAPPLLDTTLRQISRYTGGCPVIDVNSRIVVPVASVAPATNGNLNALLPATPSYQAWGHENETLTVAQKVQYRMSGFTTHAFRVLIDRGDGYVYVSKTPTVFPANGSQNYLTLVFTSRQLRGIKIEVMQNDQIIHIAVAPGDTLAKPADFANPMLALATGDSYSEGTGATLPGLYAWTKSLGRRMGWTDVRQIAVGQTGYLSNNNGARKTILQQIQDVFVVNNDISPIDVRAVNLAGGYNDYAPAGIPDPNSILPARALLTFQTWRAVCPNAVIVVYGSHAGARGPDAQTLAVDTIIRNAFALWGDPNSIYIPIAAAVPPWTNGTGFIGATNGTGNSDTLIAADGSHPSDAGHAEYSRRGEIAFDIELAKAA